MFGFRKAPTPLRTFIVHYGDVDCRGWDEFQGTHFDLFECGVIIYNGDEAIAAFAADLAPSIYEKRNT